MCGLLGIVDLGLLTWIIEVGAVGIVYANNFFVKFVKPQSLTLKNLHKNGPGTTISLNCSGPFYAGFFNSKYYSTIRFPTGLVQECRTMNTEEL